MQARAAVDIVFRAVAAVGFRCDDVAGEISSVDR